MKIRDYGTEKVDTSRKLLSGQSMMFLPQPLQTLIYVGKFYNDIFFFTENIIMPLSPLPLQPAISSGDMEQTDIMQTSSFMANNDLEDHQNFINFLSCDNIIPRQI